MVLRFIGVEERVGCMVEEGGAGLNGLDCRVVTVMDLASQSISTSSPRRTNPSAQRI